MKKQFLFAVSALGVLMASCSNNDSPTAQDGVMAKELGVSVNIASTSTTRSLIDAFSSGSAVGVFVSGTGYTSKFASYAYDGTAWSGPSDVTKKIYLSPKNANVYAFYPDTAGVAPSTSLDMSAKTLQCFSPANQDFTATTATDYMVAGGSASDVPPASLTIPVASSMTATSYKANLYFHHVMSKVSFVVNKNAYYPTGAASGAVTKIGLTAYTDASLATLDAARFPLQGVLGLGTGTYTASTTNATSALALTGTANANEYNATTPTTVTASGLFAPCSSLANIKVAITVDGRVMTKTLPISTVPAWASAYNYVYTITITPTELVVSSCTILPWTASTQDAGTVN